MSLRVVLVVAVLCGGGLAGANLAGAAGIWLHGRVTHWRFGPTLRVASAHPQANVRLRTDGRVSLL